MHLCLVLIVLLLPRVSSAGAEDQTSFRFDRDDAVGELRVMEGEVPVLTYVFGDRLPEGVDEQYVRSCYVHPLFDLDGHALTDDFPKDHPHHRGLGWVWPRMKVGEREVQTWHPSPLRQHFVRFTKQEAATEKATLGVEVEWRLEEKVVATEAVAIVAHTEKDGGRAIDFDITMTAGDEAITLQGAAEKGYGGFVLRAAPDFTGKQARTSEGKLTEDAVGNAFRWGELTTGERGVAIFTPPTHPDAPPPWMIRTSYAGILNVAWPGVEPFVLAPGESIDLSYRIWIHTGATAEEVEGAYKRYVEGDTRK